MIIVSSQRYLEIARTTARGVVQVGGTFLGATITAFPAGIVGIGVILTVAKTSPDKRMLSLGMTKALATCGFYVVVVTGGYMGNRVAKKIADFVIGQNPVRQNHQE